MTNPFSKWKYLLIGSEMKKFSFLLFLILPCTIFCQTKVYIGDQKFLSDMIYQIENKIVYRYTNPAIRIDVLYMEGDKVYLKDRKFNTDVKYTIQNNCIYLGSSTSTFDKLFTLKDDKLYVGDSSFQSDCLFTFKEGIVYIGDSTSSFDAIMSYEIDNEADLINVAMLIVPY